MKTASMYDDEIAELEREIKRIRDGKLADLERRFLRLVFLRRGLRISAANHHRMKDPAKRAQIGNTLRQRSAKARSTEGT